MRDHPGPAVPVPVAGAAPKGSLHITVQSGRARRPSHWTLTCDPAGGTHPHADAACAALLADQEPVRADRRGPKCPMILANARRSPSTGTWYGARVDRTIVDGGCTMATWSKLNQVVY